MRSIPIPSVGQRRTLARLCAMNSDQPLLVLDESISHMDQDLRRQAWAWEAVTRREETAAVVLSLHEEARIAQYSRRVDFT